MFEIDELSFDDLHDESIDEDLAELAAEGIMPSGVYDAIAHNYVLFDDEGRETARINYQLFDETGRTLRRVSLKVSWQKVIVNGRFDKAFTMYGKLTKALGSTTGRVREVLPLTKEVVVRLKVSEAYLADAMDVHPMHTDKQPTSDGKVWAVLPELDGVRDDEINDARKHYLGKGLEPIYLIQNILEGR